MQTQCPTCGTETPDSAFESWVGLSELQSRCASLITDIAHQPEVSEEEHAANKPGGPANPATNAQGWLWYLCWLHRKQAGSPLSVAKSKPQLAKFNEQEAEDLQALLFEKPVYVKCAGQQRGVYPKGDFAIDRIALIGIALHWLMPRRAAVEAAETTAESLQTLRMLIEMQHELEREFVWIATHPGPDVPWEDNGTWEHSPPKWTRSKGGYDFPIVQAAYFEVNYRRSNVIAERTRALAGHTSDTMSAESFTGVMASELGRSSPEIVHKWSRGALTAIAFTKWEATEKAHAKAEAKSKAGAR